MNGEVRPKKAKIQDQKPPAFTLRCRVELELDLDLATYLGDYILSRKCDNPAAVALAHQLQKLIPLERPLPEEGQLDENNFG